MGNRPLAPKGGNDRVYTPDVLATQIVARFKPNGDILEPCRGQGAFTRAMPSARWCEIDEGIDFFAWHQHVDWIVTNPPWSQFRAFLKRSMTLSESVVFLSLTNAFFMKARLRDMEEAEFGFREIRFVSTPPPSTGWPQAGFALSATWIQRGYTGDVKVGKLQS